MILTSLTGVEFTFIAACKAPICYCSFYS